MFEIRQWGTGTIVNVATELDLAIKLCISNYYASGKKISFYYVEKT